MAFHSQSTLAVVLILYTALCFFCMYFCLLADPGTSPIAKLVQITIPNAIWSRLLRTVGKDKMNIMQHILDRMLMMTYFVVVGGSWSVVFWYLYPWLYESPGVSNVHGVIGVVVFISCFISWAVANSSHPGKITAQSFQRYDHYPYDNLLFPPNKRCETTRLMKIPRSKFDRMKYHCIVPRYDHFCGWTYNTYGEENYRYFILFLAQHVLMCFYGSYCAILLFWDEISRKKLFEITFFDRATGETVKSNYFIVAQYLFARRTLEACVLVIMFVMGIALSGFLGYHLYLTSVGQTTNENTKWADIKHWYKKEQKRYAKAVKDGVVKQGETKRSSPTSETIEAPIPDDGDVTCTPGTSRQGEVLTGLSPSLSAATFDDQDYFDPGPIPKNIYDRGLKENWLEVIFPISKRKDALLLGGYSRPRPQQQQPRRASGAAVSGGAAIKGEGAVTSSSSPTVTTSSKTKAT